MWSYSMAKDLFLWVVIIITVITVILIILHHAKIGLFKNKKFKAALYFVCCIEVFVITLILFGGPILNKINSYRESVLSESEEECKREDAPIWCHL